MPLPARRSGTNDFSVSSSPVLLHGKDMGHRVWDKVRQVGSQQIGNAGAALLSSRKIGEKKQNLHSAPLIPCPTIQLHSVASWFIITSLFPLRTQKAKSL